MATTSPVSSGGPPTPPPGGGPTPLTIGRTFLKQYYQVLSSDNPENIIKFYKSVSVVSHGEGSEITRPVTLEALGPAGLLQDRLFSSSSFRLELEHGAIDAQESVGGGILVVVTGHMYLSDTRRAFCHTFFLNPANQGEGQRKQFYVHNDVLRFLFEDGEAAKEDNDGTPAMEAEPAVVEVEEQVVVEPPTDSRVPVVSEEEPSSGDTTQTTEAPTEVAVLEQALEEANKEDEAVVESKSMNGGTAKEESKAARRKSRSRKDGRRKSPSPTNEGQRKPATSSWASLVASGGDTPKRAAPAGASKTGEKESKKAESPPKDATASPADVTKPVANDASKAPARPKRDPECTIVIKNITGNMNDSDVRTLFDPFAKETKTKIVGINVSGSRGLGFVDFDSPAPVLLALERKDQLMLNGRVLDVEHKSHGGRTRRRSGSPKDSGAGNGSRGSRPSSRNRGPARDRGGRGGRGAVGGK